MATAKIGTSQPRYRRVRLLAATFPALVNEIIGGSAYRRFRMHLLGPTRACAVAPRDQPDELGDMSVYACTVRTFADACIDFSLIDGLYRGHVAKLMMPKIKPGGLLIIDNVNWYLPSRSHAPASRTPALGPNGRVWHEVAQELADWRSIWTQPQPATTQCASIRHST